MTNPSKKEYYEEKEEGKEYYCRDEISVTNSIISGVLFFVAAYISWGCNSMSYPEMGDFEKVGRAFFAGIFGFFYLIMYVIFWSSDCNKAFLNLELQKKRGGN
jgi:hypothetical protein